MNKPLISSEHKVLTSLAKSGYRLTPGTLQYKLTDGAWIPTRHLLYIDKIVASALIKGNARIIITMPPRHGKSEYCSVATPTWFLDKWPETYVVLTSYSSDLATDFSRRVRDTMASKENENILRVRLKQDAQKPQMFLTQVSPKPGGMIAVGIGGPITGRGPHLLLIDDYIKNHEEALSQTTKKGHWNWWQGTIYPRLEPDASVIILATRWAQDDLIGHILAKSHESWTVIRLPAFAEYGDPLGRAIGEALWPERYPVEVLRIIQEAMGKYWFQAQYQGDPLASMSGVERSKTIRIISEGDMPNKNLLKTVRTWDLAGTQGGGDFTVGQRMSVHKDTGMVFIDDLRRFQLGAHDTQLVIREVADIDGPGVAVYMEQEPGSAGKYVIEDYKKEVLPDRKFDGERATGPVEVRCSPFLAGCEAGKIHFVHAGWNQEALDEIDSFPGPHDDIVVAMSIGYRKLVRGMLTRVIWGDEEPRIVRATVAEQRIIKGAVW